MKTATICLILALSSLQLHAGINILDNPGAESDYASWTVTNGGSGWAIATGTGGLGTKSWASSFQTCTLVQTIDLLAKGYTAEVLDLSPTITAGAFVYPGWASLTSCGTITIKVELLDGSSSVISTTYISNNESLPITMLTWTDKGTTISGYPSGMRSIRMTLSGKDSKNWTGQYGPIFDDAYIQVNGSMPVELTSFTVTMTGKNVELQWNTATEINNYGFDIEKKTDQQWNKIGFVSGNGTTNSAHSYSFVDREAAGKISYRLKQIDHDGKFKYSNAIEANIIGSVKEFLLGQNYPNPFNPTTIIAFALPAAGFTTLKVYDISGKEVATLVNEYLEAGVVQTQFNASHLSSGVYIYSLRSGSYAATKKLVLTK